MTAYVRNPDKLAHVKNDNFKVIRGQLQEQEAMENAVRGQDGVLIALGANTIWGNDTTCSSGTREIMAAMKKTGVNRMVVCSSWGAGPENRHHVNWFIRWMLKNVLADKDIQEAEIEKSGLTYTIVRPPRLMDVAARGNLFSCLDQRLAIQQISREDVAIFMLQVLKDNSFVNQAPAISWSA